MKQNIYVIDWFTSKFFIVDWIWDDVEIKLWDQLLYQVEDINWKTKKSVWKYVGNVSHTNKKVKFDSILKWKDKDYFNEQQKLALKIFPKFKKEFKELFPNSIPVTARFHTYLDQLYLYFYSEERYIFTEFVRKFRQEIWKNIFLFQVGARDMMRIDPSADNLECDPWILPMHCKTNMELPSIEIENIALQNLEWRDIERLKGRCNKLKCSMIYEMDLYAEEIKQYPLKWANVESKKLGIKWIVYNINVVSGDVQIKTKEWWLFRVPINSIDKKKS